MRTHRTQKSRRHEQGFTLVEIMIVLGIIGIIASIVGTNIFGRFKMAKVDGARLQLAAYEQALQAFYLDNGFYPHTSQGLESLSTKPSSGRVPKNYPDGGYLGKKLKDDPWGAPYRYVCEDSQKYVISSDGPDGQPETEDDVYTEEAEQTE